MRMFSFGRRCALDPADKTEIQNDFNCFGLFGNGYQDPTNFDGSDHPLEECMVCALVHAWLR